MEPLFYACESENGLAQAAGEHALQFLSGYLGPNILRGRVNNLDQARYLNILDRVMAEPMDVEESAAAAATGKGMAIPTTSKDGEMYSNLGGTPT